MILVTGATGFVGRALLPRLVEAGHEVRCLLRPSKRSPNLPKGLSVQVAIAALDDPRAMRAALAGVDTLVHLAGAEWRGGAAEVTALDVGGTRDLLEAARAARVERFVYLSHLGADRASAYPVLKAKGIAEEFVRQSGLRYLVFRSAMLFGPEDRFANVLAAVLKLSPGFFLMPGDGRTALQPLWVDDLATCIEWSLADPAYLNQTFAIGGPEFVPLRQLVETIQEVLGISRAIVPVRPVYLRALAWLFEQAWPQTPLNTRWLDYLATSRTCELTSVTHHFGLKPVRFTPATLSYMRDKRWLSEMTRLVFSH